MRDPADLPLELFTLVLDFALHGESNVQRLCSLSHLSQKWHTVLLSRIYSEWTFNGARQPFLTLWKFFRTVRGNPHLAALVQTLHIGNWGFFPEVAFWRIQDLDLPVDELELVRSTIHEAGISHLEARILESLPKRDRRPVMALLLTCLPNVSTIYAHVPSFDPVLKAVLEHTIRYQNGPDLPLPPFQLKELHLLHEKPVRPCRGIDGDADEYMTNPFKRKSHKKEPDDSLQMMYLWPVFSLASLQILSLSGINLENAASRIGNSVGTSHLEELNLSDLSFTSLDIQALITHSRMLKRFSYKGSCLNDSTMPKIWECLQSHKHSLEVIDIHCGSSKHGSCGPLHIFTNLKHLSIQVQVLLDGKYHLRDTLPSTLHSLLLYMDNEENETITNLSDQIQELISSGNCSLLGTISLKRPKHESLTQLRSHGLNFLVQSDDQPQMNCRHQTTLVSMLNDALKRKRAVSYPSEEIQEPQELLLRDHSHDGDSDFDYRLRIDDSLMVHIIPFKDHIGELAFMVFKNWGRVPLPPLVSFSIYFVHADTGLVNMDGLYQELNSTYRGCTFGIRLDIYFLPGASHADCFSHYLAEKAARGSYEKQVHMFKTRQRHDIHPPSGTDFQLPGMVNKYHWLRNVLFICSGRDWYEGQCTLWYLRSGSGWKTKATRHALPLFHAEPRPINKSSPAYDFDRFNEPVDEIIMKMAGDRKESYMVWQEATSWGWRGW